ncbi:hypothetical protein BU25DRAFT_79966 [Macroventuria anomochaeta]|uniref:Uncharacterized protein n=1 Tax=Macroventuria anomochaeta TaxID=301207 RepID=A0ACB6SEB6_9PLEO|nr:uncharacterized protein BU25DRAFT_79966 [Macroventuria anomochaeta]KAF2632655.1 hypothetical protein BU25DRAFT_79966 [Macroventuria anomochaeta]
MSSPAPRAHPATSVFTSGLISNAHNSSRTVWHPLLRFMVTPVSTLGLYTVNVNPPAPWFRRAPVSRSSYQPLSFERKAWPLTCFATAVMCFLTTSPDAHSFVLRKEPRFCTKIRRLAVRRPRRPRPANISCLVLRNASVHLSSQFSCWWNPTLARQIL